MSFRKHEHDFICDQDGPWAPVYDNSLHTENIFPKIRFIENQTTLTEDDDSLIETAERIRKLFTQFHENTN
ncbi:hypothetical protein GF337_18810 [candidate division KSB1 bacterium]|nr:hypothetical protein [candidate division KSB1 bacterium]